MTVSPYTVTVTGAISVKAASALSAERYITTILSEIGEAPGVENVDLAALAHYRDVTAYTLVVTRDGQTLDGFALAMTAEPGDRHLSEIVDDLRDVTAGRAPGAVVDTEEATR